MELHLRATGVTCHIGSHSVTSHLTQVNTTNLNHSQTGRCLIYLPRRDGRLVETNALTTTPARVLTGQAKTLHTHRVHSKPQRFLGEPLGVLSRAHGVTRIGSSENL